MASTEGLKAQLLSEYVPPIDEPTFLAILSDYDLTTRTQLENARQILDLLKSSAETDDIGAFDASGSNQPERLPVNGVASGGDNDNSSVQSLPEWSSNADDTSLSHGISFRDLEEADGEIGGTVYIGELDRLDEDGKVAVLAGIFSSLKPYDVRFALKKCKWDVNRAIDQLMTETFLEETGARHLGIEGFSEPDLTLRPRKGVGEKKKGRKITSGLDSPTSGLSVDSPVASIWDTAKQDIEFISTRTGSPSTQISTLYHKNNGSTRATILAIIDVQLALKLDSEDPIIQSKTIDLSHEFPIISPQKLQAIIQITHPSDAYAHELAKAIVPPKNTKPNIQIEIRHAPLNLSDAGSSSPKRQGRTISSQNSDVDLETSTAEVAKYTQTRDTAFQQARSAYRKGKSDHLMGGAAAYYSQKARDADAAARAAMSDASDARVAAQSSRHQVDLHGCNVNDAMRLAREYVTAWWHQAGLERGGAVNGGGATSFKVVTGRGNHSEGRAGKLGPAVGKMLIREGWRIEVTPGHLVVRGVVTKK